eukprot:maker-scaffold53_size449031-snap-gene-0.14 protein:Tk04165 transcript:maker-scaffold53_size449031-snap-gene-0.14-mRNA-1 annotation:"hypothetical protein DAPPUDRAFT_51643"
MDSSFSVQLSNGVSMPILGLGTTHNGGYNHDTVVYAVKECGYRLIDTAKRYGTESYIGQAIQDSGIDREDFFLTSKLWPTDYGLDKTITAFQASAERLRTDYLDLYLLHWPEVPSNVPNRKECLEETWRALELLVEGDKCRAIGVSNFLEQHLEHLIENASIVPHVNQCEFHPFQNPIGLRNYCTENGIQFEGYCPLAKGRILDHPQVVNIANKLNKTPAQILLRWSIQNGVVTIPKSTKKERVRENCEFLQSDFVGVEVVTQLVRDLEHLFPGCGLDHQLTQLSHSHSVVDGGSQDPQTGADDRTQDRPVLGLLGLGPLLLVGVSDRIGEDRKAFSLALLHLLEVGQEGLFLLEHLMLLSDKCQVLVFTSIRLFQFPVDLLDLGLNGGDGALSLSAFLTESTARSSGYQRHCAQLV